MNALLDALGYVGDTLDKALGGRAVRGVLGGRPDEALSILPFSDTTGLTDPTRRVTGEDLVTDHWGLADRGSWGGTLGGIGAELLLDPLTLASGGLGAFRGVRAGAKALGGLDLGGAVARRLGAFRGPASESALGRRLAELGADVDPLEKLRAGLRPHPATGPAPGSLGHLLGDETGGLAFPSPEYPGGMDKLREIVATSTRGARRHLEELLAWPGAEGLAGEIPAGSRALGAGVEGVALGTPGGGVIRLEGTGGYPRGPRPVAPEVLQPFRAADYGGYQVEHLPRVAPVDAIDLDPMVTGANSPGYTAALAAGGDAPERARAWFRAADQDVISRSQAYRQARDELELSAYARGLWPTDLHRGNVSQTPEGRWLAHDPGALSLGHGAAARPLTPPGPDFRPPALIREGDPATLRRALEEAYRSGAPGQGVDLPVDVPDTPDLRTLLATLDDPAAFLRLLKQGPRRDVLGSHVFGAPAGPGRPPAPRGFTPGSSPGPAIPAPGSSEEFRRLAADWLRDHPDDFDPEEMLARLRDHPSARGRWLDELRRAAAPPGSSADAVVPRWFDESAPGADIPPASPGTGPSPWTLGSKFLADESGALDVGPLLDRLRGDPSALDRRLAELKGPVDPFDALRADLRARSAGPAPGSLRHFLADETGALQPFRELGRRTDPDVINARPWYHGSLSPDLTPATLDPLRSSPRGMLGRGIYLAGDPEYARSYAGMQGPVYEAATNLGTIADVDRPASRGVVEAMRDAALGHNTRAIDVAAAAGQDLSRLLGDPEYLASLGRKFRPYDDVPLWDYLQSFLQNRSYVADKLRATASGPFLRGDDDLIRALRGEGIDALVHTEGRDATMRAMQEFVDPLDPRNISLSVLDPNDAVSTVGRAGQITRFDPRDPASFTPSAGPGRVFDPAFGLWRGP